MVEGVEGLKASAKTHQVMRGTGDRQAVLFAQPLDLGPDVRTHAGAQVVPTLRFRLQSMNTMAVVNGLISHQQQTTLWETS